MTLRTYFLPWCGRFNKTPLPPHEDSSSTTRNPNMNDGGKIKLKMKQNSKPCLRFRNLQPQTPLISNVQDMTHYLAFSKNFLKIKSKEPTFFQWRHSMSQHFQPTSNKTNPRGKEGSNGMEKPAGINGALGSGFASARIPLRFVFLFGS